MPLVTDSQENNPHNRASMHEVLTVLSTVTMADLDTYDAPCALYDQELKLQWEKEAVEREQARKEKEEKERDGISQSKSVKKSKRDVMQPIGADTVSSSTGLSLTPSVPSPMSTPNAAGSVSLTGSNPNVSISSSSGSPIVPSRPGASLPPHSPPVRPERGPTMEKQSVGKGSQFSFL
jgi:hypothetical protein